tara:strand:- start:19736 stop:20116 length:381 start_codon:yes stop_codon:yes gene_type:complete
MTDFDFAKAYRDAKAKREGEKPEIEGEPSSIEIWRVAASFYCKDYCDKHKLSPSELELADVQVSEKPKSPVVVTIRVVYKGKVIVLVVKNSRLDDCYLEGSQNLPFPSLGAAIDAIENELSSTFKH